MTDIVEICPAEGLIRIQSQSVRDSDSQRVDIQTMVGCPECDASERPEILEDNNLDLFLRVMGESRAGMLVQCAMCLALEKAGIRGKQTPCQNLKGDNVVYHPGQFSS